MQPINHSYDLDHDRNQALESKSTIDAHTEFNMLTIGTVDPFSLPSWQMPDDGYEQNIALLPSFSFAEPCSLNGVHEPEDTHAAFLRLPEPAPSAYYPESQEGHSRTDAPSTYYPDGIAAPIDPQLFSFPHDGAAEGAFASRYLHSSSQPPRIGHSRMARPFAPTYIPCAWGPHCGIPLDDLSPSGIARHLKEHHFREPSHGWHPKSRGHCQWRDTDGLCHKELNYASFGKHVAAVHLQSTSRACPYCFQQLGRADSLERHIKNYCPRSGRAEKKP